MLVHLETHDLPKEGEIRKNARLKEEFDQLQKLSNNVEKEISPNVKQESEKTKANIKRFEEDLKQYYVDLKKESFYSYKTGVENAFKRLEEVNEQISQYE